jgi:hypothetical protein
VMGTGIDSCVGNGDIGCCCCCQDGVKTGTGGWVVIGQMVVFCWVVNGVRGLLLLILPFGTVRAAGMPLGSAGGTEVGKDRNWEGAVQDYAHRTQVATAGNTTTALVLDECTSPSLPMSGPVRKKAASDPAQIAVLNTSHCSSAFSTQVSTWKERTYEPGEWRWW